MHDAFDGADVLVLLAFVPAALAGDDGASCRDANFLNALNIFNSFLCAQIFVVDFNDFRLNWKVF